MTPPADPDRVISLSGGRPAGGGARPGRGRADAGRADGRALPRWHPGSHLDIALPSGRLRQYSLCGDPADTGTYRIAVRRIADGGGGSIEVHDGLPVGSGVTTHGPRNAFPLTVPGYGSPAQCVRFIAGGIGITPILPMLALARASRRGLVDGVCRPQPRQPAVHRRGEPVRESHRDPHRRRRGCADRGRPARGLQRRHDCLCVRTRTDVDGDPKRSWSGATTSSCTSSDSPRRRSSTAASSPCRSHRPARTSSSAPTKRC